MSASKLDTSGVFESIPLSPLQSQFALSRCKTRIHKNGIEFCSDAPVPMWTEMTVDLESPRNGKRVHCRGIIVACKAKPEGGYRVSMVFLNLSRQSRMRLNSLA
jgi:hypothetical protein